MAIVSTAKTEVGTVKVMFGDVKIVGVDGVVRNTCVGDKVYAKEVIQTAANAVVQVQLADGRMLDLGRNSEIAMDESVLGASRAGVASTGATGDNVADIQARIAAGEDPTKITEAAAAGGNPLDAAEGTHEPVVVNQANSTGPVTSGFQTNPVAIAFEQAVPVELLPTALPLVSVRVFVEVPDRPPASDGPADVPVARNDVDAIARGTFLATGNVVTGAGTTSGTAGADTPGSEGASVTDVTGLPGKIATKDNNGVLTIEGQYGTLILNPDGNYTYNRTPGSPDGVVDTFTYTLTDGSGDKVTAKLIIDIGTPVIPGDEPGGDGAVVTVDGALILEGTHPDAKEITFVLTLDRPSTVPVDVTYEIRPGTATNPNDFFGVVSATVTIPAGVTRVDVPVKIVQDHLVEGNEGFSIVITNAVNANVNPEANTAQITIVDDDRPPVAQDDTYNMVRGQPNNFDSVLTHRDPGETAAGEDSGAGPFETLTIVPSSDDTLLPNGDIRITTAQGGTVVMHPDGTFTYNPPANLQGPDTFVYTMTDGFNGNDSATVTINPPPNEPATVRFNVTPADAQVNEAGLAIGSNPSSDSEKIQGTFTISDPDGVADIVFVTINGQQIPVGSLPGTVITTPVGMMTINSFDPNTGVVSFTYELKTPVTDVPNQPEQDLLTVTVTDNSETTSAPAILTINIIDDVPVARNDTDSVAAGSFAPESGNVITAAGTTSGAPR
jgi:large repetitive protein